MKSFLRNVSMLMFVVLFFANAVSAEAINDTLQISVATNSNIAKRLNDLANMEITKPDLWYRTKSGLWYYFKNNWSTIRTGWFVDPRDGQTYYLKPENGIMAVGWKKIGDNEYYFYDNKEAENCWIELGGGFYEKSLNGKPVMDLCLEVV